MSWSKLYFFLGILVFCSCNSNVDMFQKIVIDYKADTTKDILLIVYKPLECLACNAGVSNIFSDYRVKDKFGSNIYFMYNGIRDIELNDYKNNFKETIEIDAKMINQRDLYTEIFQNLNVSTERLKPTCIVLYKNGKQPKVENMKDSNIVAKICL